MGDERHAEEQERGAQDELEQEEIERQLMKHEEYVPEHQQQGQMLANMHFAMPSSRKRGREMSEGGEDPHQMRRAFYEEFEDRQRPRGHRPMHSFDNGIMFLDPVDVNSTIRGVSALVNLGGVQPRGGGMLYALDEHHQQHDDHDLNHEDEHGDEAYHPPFPNGGEMQHQEHRRHQRQPSFAAYDNPSPQYEEEEEPPTTKRVATKRETLEEIMATRVQMTTLEQYLDIPLKTAAERMRVSVTTLKRICRKYGVKKWPHRQLQGIDRALAQLESRIHAHRWGTKMFGETESNLREQIVSLQLKRANVIRAVMSGESADINGDLGSLSGGQGTNSKLEGGEDDMGDGTNGAQPEVKAPKRKRAARGASGEVSTRRKSSLQQQQQQKQVAEDPRHDNNFARGEDRQIIGMDRTVEMYHHQQQVQQQHAQHYYHSAYPHHMMNGHAQFPVVAGGGRPFHPSMAYEHMQLSEREMRRQDEPRYYLHQSTDRVAYRDLVARVEGVQQLDNSRLIGGGGMSQHDAYSHHRMPSDLITAALLNDSEEPSPLLSQSFSSGHFPGASFDSSSLRHEDELNVALRHEQESHVGPDNAPFRQEESNVPRYEGASSVALRHAGLDNVPLRQEEGSHSSIRLDNAPFRNDEASSVVLRHAGLDNAALRQEDDGQLSIRLGNAPMRPEGNNHAPLPQEGNNHVSISLGNAPIRQEEANNGHAPLQHGVESSRVDVGVQQQLGQSFSSGGEHFSGPSLENAPARREVESHVGVSSQQHEQLIADIADVMAAQSTQPSPAKAYVHV